LPEVTREFVDEWLTETLEPGGNFLQHYYRIDESHFLFDGKKCLRNTLKATDLPIQYCGQESQYWHLICQGKKSWITGVNIAAS
jgi:hypothetical protein